ncbi:MAG TPA: hypothetical protein VEH57_07215 [Thermoplasmata archaeon]|nr:hypothetical protein [Thermoplasmata archaeon]
MGEAPVSRLSRRSRRARRFRRQRRGVVSVIGTLLALLVFFALFGIFLTQYVPLWMTDNEAQFVAQTEGSFALLKSEIDQQYALGAPIVVGTPFALSSQGIPLLAQPTQGTLAFLPTTCPGGFYAKGMKGATTLNYGQPVNSSFCVFSNVTYSVGPGGSGMYSQRIATGVLTMALPNRYYSAQQFVFEDDGVIQLQSGGHQVMTYSPPLNVTDVAGNTTVSTALLQLYGNASTIVGQGTQEVYSHYRFTQTIHSNGKYVASNSSYLPFNFTFEIGTQYPCAWWGYLYNVTQVSGVPSSSISLSPVTPPTSCTILTGLTTVLKLTVSNVNYATFFFAGVQLSIGAGVT